MKSNIKFECFEIGVMRGFGMGWRFKVVKVVRNYYSIIHYYNICHPSIYYIFWILEVLNHGHENINLLTYKKIIVNT